MPLESLRQPFDPEQAGHKLREVQIEHEPKKEETARERWESLKKSPMWVESEQAWMSFDFEHPERKPAKLYTEPQLWGLVAEHEFNPQNARDLFSHVRKKFYSERIKAWTETDEQTQSALIDEYFAEYMLAQLGLEKDGREKRYSMLNREAGDVLVDQRILLELISDPKTSKEHYDERYFVPLRLNVKRSLHSTFLALYIESKFYPERAKEDYDDFKKRWFNEETGYWEEDANPKYVFDTIEILDVLIRLELEKAGLQGNVSRDTHKLPEERNF